MLKTILFKIHLKNKTKLAFTKMETAFWNEVSKQEHCRESFTESKLKQLRTQQIKYNFPKAERIPLLLYHAAI